MAQAKKNNSGRKPSAAKKSSSGRSYQNKNQNTKRNVNYSEPMDTAIKDEIVLIALFAVSVFLFLCNFGVIGMVGDAISRVMFGIFGITAYIVPIVFFLMIAFGMVNSGNHIATRKLVVSFVLFLIIGMIFELFTKAPANAEAYDVKAIYAACSENKNGGGILAGSLAYFCYHFMGLIGTVLVLLVAAIISFVILTEKSFVSGVKSSGRIVYEKTREDARYRRERTRIRREELDKERQERKEQKLIRDEELENEKILRMDKKVKGVIMDTSLSAKEESASKERDDIHEINIDDFNNRLQQVNVVTEDEEEDFDFSAIQVKRERYTAKDDESDEIAEIKPSSKENDYHEHNIHISESYTASEPVVEPVTEPVVRKPVATPAPVSKQKMTANDLSVENEISKNAQENAVKPVKKYIFPPIHLLNKGKGKSGGDSDRELKETAKRLQQTLQNFGVKVTITDISQGPAVTRYEMQPEMGVKVSKIVGLTDDIKLNLAATDIRIEAPIPGKAAVGIEVPNKENSAVALRDLLETSDFKDFSSNLAFAVGKDIAGKVVVADIAKMPHMLIAGATGSGKSVCINTLIMSILYKAHPDDVKLIMIDPKVVELSVYNGIPHLLIPVVTDPKKAAAALHWGVAEMTDRYQKFADYNVRDLKGYNQKVQELKDKGEADAPAKLPQIVIIVDELADLMMVAPGEVEESICRLAQLARACGIHLIIATQRPSVDVITGLIKANMPSRVAFSVSSGVDSRTILDMNGAEKLLGKGDMLFYPQGYSKPARVQGAFVSDKEVSDVVEYLKNQKLGNIYSEDIQQKIASIGTTSPASGGEDGSERDQYFVDAAKFIIDKDKASIGMLQRVFKIGFNRAARIMDQLCEAGVVGEEEGTKPRKVLMSMEQFEQYVDEYL
ncbi:MAG: DNA translocase FtsK [Lachnospiraceae bacterium]|nr:DNA translocase FtsK [Lachnospiraceae bacterium]